MKATRRDGTMTRPGRLRRRRPRSVAVPFVSTLVAVAIAALAPGAGAAKPSPTGLLLTLAARTCPSYTDITANKARNNIMESLRDLGPDTPYSDGENVDPRIEAAVQPNCRPLPGWSFTFGDDYTSRAVAGPWGVLSVIKGQLREPVVTKAETPLLNAQGEPTGDQIAGAVTIALGKEEAKLAPRGSLWVQGGTPADPVLDQLYPGPEYGFGALRCATDDVNGDNVEYVRYPAGSTHVFCFAYYVKPPPSGGTIVIRKRAVGAGAPTETFNFGGNISYESGGRFSLSPGPDGTASETFYRGATSAGGDPWRVSEEAVVDWALTDLSCTSRDGTSVVSASTADAEAAVHLGPEDVVTCTFTNEYSPPPQGLVIRKITEGGVGRFDFSVKPAGGGSEQRAVATTEREGVAVDAKPARLALDPGRYRIAEDLPTSDEGHWKIAEVQCGGEKVPVEDGTVEATVAARAVETCTFTNAFVPKGSIAISKITDGAVGTTGFEIESSADPEATFQQRATTGVAGIPAKAEGDSTDRLELGRYTVTESPPAPGKGEWELREVRCDGKVMPFAEGRIELILTANHPHSSCAFVNRFRAAAEPPLPPARRPEQEQSAHLVISKRLLTARPEAGEVLEYAITVTNEGPGDAATASVTDQPLGPARLVFARPSQGRCGETLPVVCDLGTLAAGATATVRVGIISSDPGRLLNRAVAGTSSDEGEIAGVEAEAPADLQPSEPTVSPVPGLG
jgi:uncharacterized repeat protein (TIGR01451 family)